MDWTEIYRRGGQCGQVGRCAGVQAKWATAGAGAGAGAVGCGAGASTKPGNLEEQA